MKLAQELRIGNYLQRADGSSFQVTVEDIRIIEGWKTPIAPLPKGIPLTEEWLLKFGFEKDETMPDSSFCKGQEQVSHIQDCGEELLA